MLPYFGTSIPNRIIATIWFDKFSAWPSSVPAVKYGSVTMRTCLKSALIVVSVLMIFSNAAYADLGQDLEVNIFGIGTIHSSKDYEIAFPQSPTPIKGHFNFDKGIGGGFRVNVYSRGHWGEEFYYSYEPNTAHFTRQGTPTSTLNLDMNLHKVGVNALYYLNDDETHRIRPFLSVGGGWAIFAPTEFARQVAKDPLRGNVPDLDAANEISANYGAGFKAKLTNRIGIRVDVKGFVGRNPSFGLARASSDPNATVFPAAGAIHTGEASAGFVFYFGNP
jgi:outer membrane protein W